ncbi:DUF1566 domain-containing protein [Microbulbifer bruguierae]|uniref:DUF1566 domain-containing protein n=1 Tax=Microbulbifer bruguierae TaxID=3029061 RepID=A0ABY8N9Z3_9GAMM|nr:DUF1566 domain-containing protein [Microbulbifer bruguierae]WGL15721.1 DUF1566 domain-containing protein [Microbulbifer bruguierae]
MKKIAVFILLSAVALNFLCLNTSRENINFKRSLEIVKNVFSRISHIERETSDTEREPGAKTREGALNRGKQEEAPDFIHQKSTANSEQIDIRKSAALEKPAQENEGPEEEKDKTEDGRFSKIDKHGNLLPADATNWSCIFDKETKLTWENKIRDSGIHNANNKFTWFDPNVESGIFSGVSVSENTCTFYTESTDTYCSTYNLAAKVNGENLCGFSGWRLPSVAELNSIIVNRGSAAVVNKEFFPNTQKDYYWTSEAVAYTDTRAWAVMFRYGASPNDLSKSASAYARLVAGSPQ